MEYFKIDDGKNTTVMATSKVIKKKNVEIIGIGTIPIKMEFDLKDIPEKHHEICLSMIALFCSGILFILFLYLYKFLI